MYFNHSVIIYFVVELNVCMHIWKIHKEFIDMELLGQKHMNTATFFAIQYDVCEVVG